MYGKYIWRAFWKISLWLWKEGEIGSQVLSCVGIGRPRQYSVQGSRWLPCNSCKEFYFPLSCVAQQPPIWGYPDYAIKIVDANLISLDMANRIWGAKSLSWQRVPALQKAMGTEIDSGVSSEDPRGSWVQQCWPLTSALHQETQFSWF